MQCTEGVGGGIRQIQALEGRRVQKGEGRTGLGNKSIVITCCAKCKAQRTINMFSNAQQFLFLFLFLY